MFKKYNLKFRAQVYRNLRANDRLYFVSFCFFELNVKKSAFSNSFRLADIAMHTKDPLIEGVIGTALPSWLGYLKKNYGLRYSINHEPLAKKKAALRRLFRSEKTYAFAEVSSFAAYQMNKPNAILFNTSAKL